IRSGEEQCISANPLPIDHWTLPIADMEEVEGAAEQEQYKVIDVREAKRYNGEIEPIDLIAGHIPGAINVPYAENLDDRGLFLDPNILKEKYEKVFGDVDPKNVIFHCGSGVTACHSILAVAYAGFELPKLYVGSWSEWSRNEKKMVCEISHLVYSDM
ncbi:MAG TPA: rhodanese-like domain-containing protein, partial [Saprospiraceae bacterium]|nr:rhodanese-like domain-containing protein [Saprospiraceae bacterium]